MKSKKLLLLPVLLISVLTSGCGKKDDATCDKFGKITYRITNNHSMFDDEVTKDDTFEFDYKYFIDRPNYNHYDKDISKLSILLCAESYDWCNVQVKEKDSYLTDKTLLQYLKVKDIEFIQILPEDYQYDTSDVTAAYLGHYDFYYKNRNQQVFFIVFCGTLLDCEWSSNFDVGPDTKFDNYITDLTPRIEWEHKENHKGFDITTNRIKVKIKDYLSRHVDTNAKQTYLITGHSRGGSIANLFGKYVDDQNMRSFVYTFAGANVTTEEMSIYERMGRYNNIYNVVNAEDTIAHLPPSEDFGFRKFGITIEVSGKQYATEWNEFCQDREYVYIYPKGFIDMFKTLVLDRDYLYVIPENHLTSKEKQFDTKAEADMYYQLMNMILNSIPGASSHLTIKEAKHKGGKWVISYSFLPALYLDIFGALTVLDLNVVSTYLPYLSDLNLDVAMPYLTDLMINGLDGFGLPHMPESYVIINNYID